MEKQCFQFTCFNHKRISKVHNFQPHTLGAAPVVGCLPFMGVKLNANFRKTGLEQRNLNYHSLQDKQCPDLITFLSIKTKQKKFPIPAELQASPQGFCQCPSKSHHLRRSQRMFQKVTDCKWTSLFFGIFHSIQIFVQVFFFIQYCSFLIYDHTLIDYSQFSSICINLLALLASQLIQVN